MTLVRIDRGTRPHGAKIKKQLETTQDPQYLLSERSVEQQLALRWDREFNVRLAELEVR